MDIKPANILVKRTHDPRLPQHWGQEYQFYISDFGISSNFEDLGYSQTDRPTARSAKYCAPEIYNQDVRDRAADIFPLGCVFAEILTVVSRQYLNTFEDFRSDKSPTGGKSFHSSTDATADWLGMLKMGDSDFHPLLLMMGQHSYSLFPRTTDLVERMIRKEPSERPTADGAHKVIVRECCI